MALKALLFDISLKARQQVEKGEGTTWRAFYPKYLQGKNCPCYQASAITYCHQIINTHPQRKRQEKNKCFLFLFLTDSQQSHKSSLYIFTQSEIWIHITAINFHCLQPQTLPGYVAQRGFLWAGLQLPGSHLHKEEILVHSVYLFCVEKSRAINHEEIHSTLFHFTLLSTTLYRVTEWIFNIMPQNALVFYHMLGLYQSDNTWEFWEILSTEENSFKV